jgi:hypothetical protein
MGEAGCVKDGVFQNLEVNGFANINNTRSMVQQKVIYSPIPAAVTAAAALVAEKVFYLPTRSIITSIEIVCVDAPTITSGDIGYQVGTATTGVDLVAAGTADNILNGGTTVLQGAYYSLTLTGDTVASDPNPAAAVRANLGINPKPYYLQLTATQAASVVGSFAWIVTYKQF